MTQLIVRIRYIYCIQERALIGHISNETPYSLEKLALMTKTVEQIALMSHHIVHKG